MLFSLFICHCCFCVPQSFFQSCTRQTSDSLGPYRHLFARGLISTRISFVIETRKLDLRFVRFPQEQSHLVVVYNSNVSKTASAPMKAAHKIVKLMEQPVLSQLVVPQNSSLPAKRPAIVAQSPFSVLKAPKVRTNISSPLGQEQRHHSQKILTVEADTSDSALLPTSQAQTENREGNVAKRLENKIPRSTMLIRCYGENMRFLPNWKSYSMTCLRKYGT